MCRRADAPDLGGVLRPASGDLECEEVKLSQPRLQPGEHEAQTGQDLCSLLRQQVSTEYNPQTDKDAKSCSDCRDCAVHGPALERSEDIREARRESVSSQGSGRRSSSSSSVFSDVDMVDRWRRSTSQVRRVAIKQGGNILKMSEAYQLTIHISIRPFMSLFNRKTLMLNVDIAGILIFIIRANREPPFSDLSIKPNSEQEDTSKVMMAMQTI